MASIAPELAEAFVQLGEPISEIVKLGALLVFGATLALQLDAPALAFSALTLLGARPIALLFAFLGGGLASCAARRARYRGGWDSSTPSTSARRTGRAGTVPAHPGDLLGICTALVRS